MRSGRITVMDGLLRRGLSRRSFLKICAIAASSLALPPSEARNIAKALACTPRPRVVWLHFQECTACTEALTRGFEPTLEDLLLEIISLEYHETLMAAAGHEAEDLLREATKSDGYVLVIEGSASTRDGWCEIGGRHNIDMLKEHGLARRAALVIAVGSCAAYGGLPAASPNPSDAISVGEDLKDAINDTVQELLLVIPISDDGGDFEHSLQALHHFEQVLRRIPLPITYGAHILVGIHEVI